MQDAVTDASKARAAGAGLPCPSGTRASSQEAPRFTAASPPCLHILVASDGINALNCHSFTCDALVTTHDEPPQCKLVVELSGEVTGACLCAAERACQARGIHASRSGRSSSQFLRGPGWSFQ